MRILHPRVPIVLIREMRIARSDLKVATRRNTLRAFASFKMRTERRKPRFPAAPENSKK